MLEVERDGRKTQTHRKLGLGGLGGLFDGEATLPGSSACLLHGIEQKVWVITYSRIMTSGLLKINKEAGYTVGSTDRFS